MIVDVGLPVYQKTWRQVRKVDVAVDQLGSRQERCDGITLHFLYVGSTLLSCTSRMVRIYGVECLPNSATTFVMSGGRLLNITNGNELSLALQPSLLLPGMRSFGCHQYVNIATSNSCSDFSDANGSESSASWRPLLLASRCSRILVCPSRLQHLPLGFITRFEPGDRSICAMLESLMLAFI